MHLGHEIKYDYWITYCFKRDAVYNRDCIFNCIYLLTNLAQIKIYPGKWKQLKSYVKKKHCSKVDRFLFMHKKQDSVQMTVIPFKQMLLNTFVS